MKKLENKIIVVTGGSGLIGRSILKNVEQEGGVAINFDLSTKGISNSYKTDITNEESVINSIKLVVEKYGKIDGLVNNAYPRTTDMATKIEDMPMDSWRLNVDMNLNSCFFLCQQVSKQMKKQGRGAIVNMTSIYGVVGNDLTLYEGTSISSSACYSAYKGGIVNLTRYMSSYFGKDRIRVNCVSPGGIYDNHEAQFVANYNNKVPLGRMGKPEDISPSVVFLLSDDASYITGHNLMVDGGWTAV